MFCFFSLPHGTHTHKQRIRIDISFMFFYVAPLLAFWCFLELFFFHLLLSINLTCRPYSKKRQLQMLHLLFFCGSVQRDNYVDIFLVVIFFWFSFVLFYGGGFVGMRLSLFYVGWGGAGICVARWLCVCAMFPYIKAQILIHGQKCI